MAEEDGPLSLRPLMEAAHESVSDKPLCKDRECREGYCSEIPCVCALTLVLFEPRNQARRFPNEALSIQATNCLGSLLA